MTTWTSSAGHSVQKPLDLLSRFIFFYPAWKGSGVKVCGNFLFMREANQNVMRIGGDWRDWHITLRRSWRKAWRSRSTSSARRTSHATAASVSELPKLGVHTWPHETSTTKKEFRNMDVFVFDVSFLSGPYVNEPDFFNVSFALVLRNFRPLFFLGLRTVQPSAFIGTNVFNHSWCLGVCLFVRSFLVPLGAHWLGHQVRPRHRHLRHGLLRAFEPPRQPREESQVEGGKGGRRTQVEEGPTIPGSSKYVFVFLPFGRFFFFGKNAQIICIYIYTYLEDAGMKGQKTYRKNEV